MADPSSPSLPSLPSTENENEPETGLAHGRSSDSASVSAHVSAQASAPAVVLGSALIPAPEPTPAMYPSGSAPAPAGPALPHERCPHCGAVTFIETSSSLRQVCGICGKARVPVDDPSIPRKNPGVRALARASAARNAAVSWTVAGTVAGSFSLLSFAVLATVLAFISPGLVATLAALLAASIPLAFGAAGFVRARHKRAEIAPALDEAWALEGADVVKALHAGGQAVTIEEMSRLMRSSHEQSEHLLAQLSASGVVRSRVDDAGLRFDVSGAAVLPEALAEARSEAVRTEAAEQEALAIEQAESEASAADPRHVARLPGDTR